MQTLSTIGSQEASGASSGVIGAIKQASAESGVDFSYLLQKASTESSLNPNAKAATSSASGLYQFIDQTWLNEIAEHGAQYGLGKEAAAVSVDSSGHASVSDPAMRQEIMSLKNDPKVAAEMAASFTKDNQAALQQSVGGHIGGTELYLAHFLGAGGAAKFLTAMRQNPNQSGASVLPQAADANEPVFYHADGSARSLGEIYNRFAARFGGTGVTGTATASSPASFGAAATASSLSATPGAPSGSSWSVGATDWNNNRASLYEMMVLSQLSATQALDNSKQTNITNM